MINVTLAVHKGKNKVSVELVQLCRGNASVNAERMNE